ncbi:hypothetical protein SLS64_007516 [Diaporthe eres]
MAWFELMCDRLVRATYKAIIIRGNGVGHHIEKAVRHPLEFFNFKPKRDFKSGNIKKLTNAELCAADAATRRAEASAGSGIVLNAGIAVVFPLFAAGAVINLWQLAVGIKNRTRVKKEIMARMETNEEFREMYERQNSPLRDILLGCFLKAATTTLGLGAVGLDNLIAPFVQTTIQHTIDHITNGLASLRVPGSDARQALEGGMHHNASGPVAATAMLHSQFQISTAVAAAPAPSVEFTQMDTGLGAMDHAFHEINSLVSDQVQNALAHCTGITITDNTTWDQLLNQLADGGYVNEAVIDMVAAQMVVEGVPFPFGFSPSAMHQLAHPEGEVATSRAAASEGICMGLSSYSTVSLEEVAQQGLGNPYFMQVCVLKDRRTTLQLLQRAEAANYKAIFVSVDVPVLGRRLNEMRNSFTLPEEMQFPNLLSNGRKEFSGDNAATAFVNTTEDVQMAIDHNLDGVVISNHGGRQLDGIAATLDTLRVCAPLAKGKIQIAVDGGVRKGSDIFKAIALGADHVFVAFIDSAVSEGATLMAGGQKDLPGNKGYFVRPTVLTNVTDSMTVFREEVFGPVVVISSFETEEEAVARANSTAYGLGAAVFTKDLEKAHRVAGDIEAGMVWVNSSQDCDPRIPFGGVKQSGIGRELGEAGLEAYTQIKAVHINMGNRL